MNNSISIQVKAQLELQTRWFNAELANVTETQANLQIKDNLNPIKWVAGHLLNTRFIILGMINSQEPDRTYHKLFGKGTTNKIEADFPKLESIIAKWNELAPILNNALAGATEEYLMSVTPIQTSIPNNTVMGFISYMTIHEAHHLGQISILRRLIG